MSSTPHLCFEDFRPGDVSEYGAYPVTRDGIIAFASEFDPQPFHLDEAAAKATLLEGLAASGWHTCAMLMRINCDAFVLKAASLGAPGVSEVKWLKPVRPGHVLRVRRTTLETRPSRSRPAMGLVDFRFELFDQRLETLMVQRNVHMLGRRVPGRGEEGRSRDPTAGNGAGARPDAAPQPPPGAAGAERRLGFFEDVVVGARTEFGSHAFGRDDIIRFARAYDPQKFHLDEAAARNGPFGRLAASGWHTAAAWMKTYVEWSQRCAAAMRRRGEPVPALGPSPGFRDLKWLKPVYPGDTIAFASTVTAKRASVSRPQWGLVLNHNTGVNQHGEPVFEFAGASFLQRKP